MTASLDNCPALVLNADFRPLSYFPLSLWSWQDAIKAVFLDRVNIIDHYDVRVRSPSLEMQLPSVVSLKEYVPATRHPAFTRFNVFLRDRFCCQYCGTGFPTHELTFDHVVPRAQGGRTTWENVVCCCIDCNLTKGARTPEQAHMKLLKVPMRPRWTPTFRTNGGKVRYREWLPFLGVADASYWNVELKD